MTPEDMNGIANEYHKMGQVADMHPWQVGAEICERLDLIGSTLDKILRCLESQRALHDGTFGPG